MPATSQESAQERRHGVGKGSPLVGGQPFSTPYRPAQEGHHSVDKGWRDGKEKGWSVRKKGKSAEGSERQETNTTETREPQDAKQYKARSSSRYG